MIERDDAKKARPPSDAEPWVVADDEGVRVTFRTEDAAWRYRNEYTNRLTNPTVTYEPATDGAAPPNSGIGIRCRAMADEVFLELDGIGTGWNDEDVDRIQSSLLPRVYDLLSLIAIGDGAKEDQRG